MKRGGSQRGAVYVEFLIVFLPIFLFFLILMQLALLYVGKLGIRHAAGRAARSAVVILDDDPARYEGQARRDLQFSNTCGKNAPKSVFTNLSQAVGGGSSLSIPGKESCDGGPRVAAVRSVAAAAMAPYAPAAHKLFNISLGDSQLAGAAGKLMYAAAATAVTFPTAPGATQLATQLGENDPVYVRVTHLQICPIPIASLFLCDGFLSLKSSLDLEAGNRDVLNGHGSAWRRLRDQKPALAELVAHSPYADYLWLLAGAGMRFRVFQQEAMLPMQGANYPYQSELQ